MKTMDDGQSRWLDLLVPVGDPEGFPEAAEVVEGTTESRPLFHCAYISSVDSGQAVMNARLCKFLATGVVCLTAVGPQVLWHC